MRSEYSLTPYTLYTKIYSKRIKNLNVRPDTMELLEGNTGRILFDIDDNKIFFDPSVRVMTHPKSWASGSGHRERLRPRRSSQWAL